MSSPASGAEGLFGLADDEAMNDDFWDELLKVRGEVNKVIEQARADKKVGGSLERQSRCMLMPIWRLSSMRWAMNCDLSC